MLQLFLDFTVPWDTIDVIVLVVCLSGVVVGSLFHSEPSID
jgi:hypothetical protein